MDCENSTIIIPGGGSGAPNNASYVTINPEAALTNERILAVDTTLNITDNGANNTVVLGANFDQVTLNSLGAGTSLVGGNVGDGIGPNLNTRSLTSTGGTLVFTTPDNNTVNVETSDNNANIYNSDGTLTANRTVDQDNNSLTFDNVGIFEVEPRVPNDGLTHILLDQTNFSGTGAPGVAMVYEDPIVGDNYFVSMQEAGGRAALLGFNGSSGPTQNIVSAYNDRLNLESTGGNINMNADIGDINVNAVAGNLRFLNLPVNPTPTSILTLNGTAVEETTVDDVLSNVTLSNAGAGNSLVADGTGPTLSNKSLSAGTNISFVDSGTNITINSAGGGGISTDVDDAAGITGVSIIEAGTGGTADVNLLGILGGNNISTSIVSTDVVIDSDIVSTVVGDEIILDGANIKRLTAGNAGIGLTSDADQITITNNSPATDVTLSNAGGGETLVVDGTGPTLSNKSLSAGTNISFNVTANDIEIAAGGGFLTNNIAYVDSVNGNDGTAALNDPALPFLTIQAAIGTNDNICVKIRSGTYPGNVSIVSARTNLSIIGDVNTIISGTYTSIFGVGCSIKNVTFTNIVTFNVTGTAGDIYSNGNFTLIDNCRFNILTDLSTITGVVRINNSAKMLFRNCDFNIERNSNLNTANAIYRAIDIVVTTGNTYCEFNGCNISYIYRNFNAITDNTLAVFLVNGASSAFTSLININNCSVRMVFGSSGGVINAIFIQKGLVSAAHALYLRCNNNVCDLYRFVDIDVGITAGSLVPGGSANNDLYSVLLLNDNSAMYFENNDFKSFNRLLHPSSTATGAQVRFIKNVIGTNYSVAGQLPISTGITQVMDLDISTPEGSRFNQGSETHLPTIATINYQLSDYDRYVIVNIDNTQLAFNIIESVDGRLITIINNSSTNAILFATSIDIPIVEPGNAATFIYDLTNINWRLLSNQSATLGDEPILSNHIVKRLTSGSGISMVSDANQVTISSSGAPSSASYLTLALDASLTNERVFVPGTGLSAVDGGANGNYTLNVDFSSVDLQLAYDNSSDGTIITDGTRNGVFVLNNTTNTITEPLFSVNDNDGAGNPDSVNIAVNRTSLYGASSGVSTGLNTISYGANTPTTSDNTLLLGSGLDSNSLDGVTMISDNNTVSVTAIESNITYLQKENGFTIVNSDAAHNLPKDIAPTAANNTTIVRRLQTTDASTTNFYTIDITNNAVWIRVAAYGIATNVVGDFPMYSHELSTMAYSGTTVPGPVDTNITVNRQTDNVVPQTTLAATYSAPNMVVSITGEAGRTIEWKFTLELMQQTI